MARRWAICRGVRGGRNGDRSAAWSTRGLCVVPIPQGPEAGEAEGVLAVGPHAAPEPVPRLALATGLAQALSLSRFACGAA